MQKLNCKVGDLAIVVSAVLPRNIGQIVEVLGLQRTATINLTGQGHVWQVRVVSGRETLCYIRHKHGGRIDQFSEGPAPDRCLRPVSGLADGDAVQEDLELPGTAPSRSRKSKAAVRVEAVDA